MTALDRSDRGQGLQQSTFRLGYFAPIRVAIPAIAIAPLPHVPNDRATALGFERQLTAGNYECFIKS